ncbi:hypothetical protein, partial [Spirosoma profusum]|uniref:hypothetical protein n=1 Tax=Spirosoma profusum TaxID=2771354 RepID=UPI001CC226E6
MPSTTFGIDPKISLLYSVARLIKQKRSLIHINDLVSTSRSTVAPTYSPTFDSSTIGSTGLNGSV